jgi:NAD-dependent SIR2 family protein deacetylase
MDELIREARDVVKKAGALLVCAGAGIGVDSGLPDFRGNQGFWKAYPPFAKLGLSFVDMANPDWFHRDPQLAWGFYGHRLNLYRRTIPHDGFKLTRQWGETLPGGSFVFTSNVDGQFQKARFPEDTLLECHGSIHHLQCVEGRCSARIWSAEGVKVEVDENTMKAHDPLPTCPSCGGLARPNILMFGDWGWLSGRTEDQQDRFQDWLDHNHQAGRHIAIIECGAGTAVPTVRMTSESIARRYDATLIRINIREPQVPTGHIGIPSGALETLSHILEPAL